ncbi:hypothetical protein [Gordonia polyisoprenivorans]|uniref:hypothetical protein n=1 Tax=Gordonia polyisoprenivorans TaxID=84595 RepID=UPI001AD7E04F|nr:hypothetical protein [Gordonia polyisoprenivorans]QTI67281.1 hypothetical protein J6U32_16840 [Gordonia polyisoprenivorans]
MGVPLPVGMSVAPWAFMLGPPPEPGVVVVGIEGAVTDGWVVVGVCVAGSWHTYGGVGAGASEIVVPGWVATQPCFQVWL